MADIVKVNGLDEIGRALAAFGPELGKKYLGKATYGAAAVYRDEARQLAPVRSGALQDAIATFKRKADDASAHYAVGVRKITINRKVKKLLRILARSGEGAPHVSAETPAYYWRFQELGFHDKDGVFHIHPFLRPAFNTKTDAALEAFKTSLADGVEKAARAVKAT